MSAEETPTFTFVCPECEEDLEVNDRMKEALTEYGCVICGAAVSDAAFTPNSSACSV